jgi:magnesium transporter
MTMKRSIDHKIESKNIIKSGLPPGTIVYTGEWQEEKTTIEIIDYNKETFSACLVDSPGKCLPPDQKGIVRWITITGMSNIDHIREIGKAFKLHPLLLEDVVNTIQRPKYEEYDQHLFIVLRLFINDAPHTNRETTQISLILGPSYVLTFSEAPLSCVDMIRQRLEQQRGKIRVMGADYLLYALLDAAVDTYFITLEEIGTTFEGLETSLIEQPDNTSLQMLYQNRKFLATLRKIVWPMRELLSSLERRDVPFIKPETDIYIRDVYDHAIQIIDSIELQRDMITGLLELYLSSTSNRMNEVMKVLTIIATIFIPITFIAGVYGMNFKFMPELDWRYGYLGILGIMIAVIILMLVYFKKKKWL